MAKRAGLTNEQAKALSREKFISAGAALALEQARRNPFGSLSLRTLCDRAGLSSGAFYVLWKSMDEYYEALARELINGTADDLLDSTQQLGLLGTGARERHAQLLGALVELAEADLATLASTGLWDLSQLLVVTWGRTHLQEAGAEGYQAIDEVTADVYGRLLAEYGREPRPPLTMVEIAMVLQGLVEGIGMRQRVGLREEIGPLPEAEADAPAPLSLYALGALALLAVMTRRAGDDASLGTVVTRLLG